MMAVVLCSLLKTIQASARTSLFFKINSPISLRECSSKANEKVQIIEDEIHVEENELAIEKLRDKSRLRLDHRNLLFGIKPYSEPLRNHHHTVKYNRKLYGKYGNESGVNPGIMWPTKNDLNEIREYESIAYPLSLQEMVVAANKEVKAKEEKVRTTQENVLEKLKKLQMWKDDLRAKIDKKEADALAARERKSKMVEEVRRHFGFTVDPRDERFQQMLADKQKEQSKKDKQARMEEKERKAIERLMAKHAANLEEKTTPDGT